MEVYKNLSLTSRVRGFEIEPDAITVRFVDGARYRFTYKSAGPINIEKMKVFARQGRGLATFITNNVRFKYESIDHSQNSRLF
jgi:hypothetical protein